MVDDQTPPERPRSEPEIIPPARGGGQSDWRGNVFTDTHATHRIYVARPGPVGFALLILAIAVLMAVFMIAAVGLVLIWLPVAALAVVIAALYRSLR
jgi:hypothetical protein